jgi:hypothetical protein
MHLVVAPGMLGHFPRLDIAVVQRLFPRAALAFVVQSAQLTIFRAVALPMRGGNLQGDRCMVRVNKPIAAGLALGLAISTLATPSFAQRNCCKSASRVLWDGYKIVIPAQSP